MADGELVIVGGGLASARVVKAYREGGGSDPIRLVSADEFVPYHRPPLSKRYLRGEVDADGTLVEPEAFYRDHGVELELGTRVGRVRSGEIELEDGRSLPYDRLVIATGGSPRTLGVPGEDLPGVFRLRTLADSTSIREAAKSAKRAVVVGGSFIGSEVAASLRTLGLEVTLVHRGTGIFDVLGSEELSSYLNDLFRERGVELVLGDQVAEFLGDGRLERVRTRGGRELDADLSVEGVGVTLNLDLLEGSGVDIDNGIVVDELYESSVPGIYAVGDVANVFDPIAGRRRRIEHWSYANSSGTRLGTMLAGGDPGPVPLASFFSEVFGTTFRVYGDSVGYPIVATEGSFAEGKAAALYVEGDTLRAAIALGLDEETETVLKAAIEAGDSPSVFAGRREGAQA